MKHKFIAIGFLIIIFTFFILSFIMPDSSVSSFERRKLSQFPTSLDDLTEDLDNYFLDQFPFREQFIAINSFINRNILGIKDYNDVYVIDNNIFEIVYPLDEKSVDNFCTKTNYIIDNYLQNSNVYFSAIHDKSHFLDNNDYLKMDYDLLYNKLSSINRNYIDLNSVLSLEDYYRTDIHWKQENLANVTEKIISEMGGNYIPINYTSQNLNTGYTSINYTTQSYDNFYGASYSKAGLNLSPDTLTYLYNDYMDNIAVNHLEYGEKEIYDIAKLEGVDPYDVFLSGPSSLIEITNNNADSDKELVIFRDSFASSLAPLLVPYYSKITLIDLRYINFNIATTKVDFENKDVLFLYSTQIINNSNLLKIF